jgi:hypothetical protein
MCPHFLLPGISSECFSLLSLLDLVTHHPLLRIPEHLYCLTNNSATSPTPSCSFPKNSTTIPSSPRPPNARPYILRPPESSKSHKGFDGEEYTLILFLTSSKLRAICTPLVCPSPTPPSTAVNLPDMGVARHRRLRWQHCQSGVVHPLTAAYA